MSPQTSGDLKKISKLSYIKEQSSGDVVIGALTKLREIEGPPLKLVGVSVASSPVRMREVEGTLKGSHLSERIIAEAAQMAMKAVNPVPHHGDSPKYVREMVEAYTKKALSQLLQ